MDNHPIPQDVSSFQFRLIGDMTIKQFAYLAAGIVLAWICLSLPLFVLIKLPLILLFGGMGILLAFIPLGGRPADTMIVYFFKAVFSPTTYQYKNTPIQTATPVPPQPEKKEEKPKEDKVALTSPVSSSFTDLLQEQSAEPSHTITAPQVSIAAAPQLPLAKEQESTLEKEADAITKALQEAKGEEEKEKGKEEEQKAHEKVEDLQTQLQTILSQKQQLEEQLLQLQKQLSQKQAQPIFSPSTLQAPVTEHVKKVPPQLSKTVGTPFVSDVPNLISGIVKDPRGNVLPNILIEVKDKDNNPVRAFKTNPLGQFASATPVMNGVYTLTFEDPNNKQRFDSVELQAIGEVIEPLEVISVDAREDLRKELFGG